MPTVDPIFIRPAQADDLTLIAAIFHQAVHQVASRDYTPEQVQAWSPQEYPVAHWQQRTAGLHVRIGWIGDAAAGFIGFADDGFIDLLFTRPEYLRRGVARSLLHDAEAELQRRGVNTTYANVSITARPFFAAMGYRCLKSQRVSSRGVEFENFRMEKHHS